MLTIPPIRQVDGQAFRVPLHVAVSTRPALGDCHAVHLTKEGVGLYARGKDGLLDAAAGDPIALAFRLPDGGRVEARGRVAWACQSPRVGPDTWALNVSFRELSEATRPALDRYLDGYRFHVGVAHAAAAEEFVARSTLGERVRLHVVRSQRGVARLLARGDVACLVVYADGEAGRALLNELISGDDGRSELDPAADLRPRLVVCAAKPPRALVTLMNRGRVVAWLRPPFAPEAIEEAVRRACRTFGARTEEYRMALLLARDQGGAWRRHLQVAAQALQQGLIDAGAFAQALLTVARQPQVSNLEDVWVRSGRLRRTQLDQVLRAADEQRALAEPTRPLAELTFFEGENRKLGFAKTGTPSALAAGLGIFPAEGPGSSFAPPPPPGPVSEAEDAHPSDASEPLPGLTAIPGATAIPADPVSAGGTAIPADLQPGSADPAIAPDVSASAVPAPVVLRPPKGGALAGQGRMGVHAPAGGDALRYGMVGHLGAGGMGIVTECLDAQLSRRVALKAPRLDGPNQTWRNRLLEREARVTGSLEHPNIIPVYDAGRTVEGNPFYVMRLLRVPTLEDVLDRLRAGDTATVLEYSLGRLLRCFIQVCQAVDYAHSRGVIHCDLKPANILLGSFGEVVVADWGMAFVVSEGAVYRGGTLGYMAPEQMQLQSPGYDLASGPGIDARTDVYALGSILYEILCLEPAFPDEELRELMRHLVAGEASKLRPVAPRVRRPDREVPAELEEVCLKALEVERQARFASARDVAAAIEAFLEGTKERERRKQQADELFEEGWQLADRYFELVDARAERVAELEGLRANIPPWAPQPEKQALWEAEDRLAVADSLAVRTFHAAAFSYEQALVHAPAHQAAKRGLIALYRGELKRARERRDDFNRVYFEELLKEHEDAASAAAARGTVTVQCAGGPVDVYVSRIEERTRRLVSASREHAGTTPRERLPLPPGTYIISLEAPGVRPLRFPLVLQAGTHVKIFADRKAMEATDEGEILVPGGLALLGGDDGRSVGAEVREVNVPAFYMDERPVTFRQYLVFVERFFRRDSPLAAGLLPRHRDNAPFWEWENGQFVPARIRQWGDDLDRLLSMPVFGIDARCAESYAVWRSKRTGHKYRLPTELEWEKAGRGTDGRRYPWGDYFDSSFCHMRESRAEAPRPHPAGGYEADESPYGIRDLAGGIADWVIPPHVERDRTGARRLASRGGAWCDWRSDCVLTARRIYLSREASVRVGFRLVRDAPEGVRYEVERFTS